jgi:enoyl-CoA hydratase
VTTLEILDKNVALVRISRPEAKNALDPKTLRELAAIWQQVAEDERIRVAILTGTGDAFCAGMDLKKTIPLAKRLASGERIPDEDFQALKAVPRATLQAFRPAKPIIAAVNGHCRGQGTDMLLNTDYRLAVPEATFALEEVSLGLFPRGNTTEILGRQIPWVYAVELALSAVPFWTAERALKAGLLNEIVEPESLLARAEEVARRLASFDPELVRAVLFRMRDSVFGPDLEQRVASSHKIADKLARH